MKFLYGCILIAACSMAASTSASAQDSQPDIKKLSENANAALVAARQATKEKRYADSEALMQAVTTHEPQMILPWVEFGLAQMGLKKYAEAENSFKVALGLDPASQKLEHNNDFYQQVDAKGVTAPSATRASRNTVGGTVSNAQARTPEIEGICWSGLGEIYIHQGKVAEANAAFDSAVKIYPTSAALFRRNETIYFFQAGLADAQLAAAEKAIAVDPGRAMLYFFKGQALVSKATVDPATQKIVLPPGCAEAFQKYLAMEPGGPYAANAQSILTSAGITPKGKK